MEDQYSKEEKVDKQKDQKRDEVTPSDPKLRQQPEIREPSDKRSEPIIKVE